MAKVVFEMVFLAVVPVLWLVVALSVIKTAAHKAALQSLVITVLLASLLWKQSLPNVGFAAAEGVLTVLWPIAPVIIASLFTYNLVVRTGAMDSIKRMLSQVSNDQRVLALLIGWGFANFMEGIAGFGTAVAIPAAMLVALGIKPLSAVVACIVVNSTPTAFGSVGLPAITLASVTGLDPTRLVFKISMLQFLHTVISPFLLVAICSQSVRAIRGVLGMTVIASISYTFAALVAAKYIGAELPNILGSAFSMICIIAFSKLFPPKEHEKYILPDAAADDTDEKTTLKEKFVAWSPFFFIFVLLILASRICPPVHDLLSPIKSRFAVYPGEGANMLTFSWADSPGVLIMFAAVTGGILQKASFRTMGSVFGQTLWRYKFTILTICSVMATAKIMTYSGMISDIAVFLVRNTGALYPCFAPVIGALGGFVTGSGTSSCVLFGPLQTQSAIALNLDSGWIASANILGAGIGKMVSPQSIAIGASVISVASAENKILMAVFKFFAAYLLLAGAEAYLFVLFLGR